MVARRSGALWVGLAVVALVAVGALAWAGFRALPTGALKGSALVTLQEPAAVGLQQSDLPSALSRCDVSGPIERYLQLLQASGSPSYEITQQQWSALRANGASVASVQSFAANPEDCQARLAERKGPSAISFAIRFRTPAGAVAAFREPFLTLRPAPGMVLPGLVQGEATGLGPNSWIYDQTNQKPSIIASYWAVRAFAVFLFAEQIPSDDARRAATGMNSRIH